MRIVVHDYAGHPFQFDLSRELARRGHEVMHAYFGGDQGPKGETEKLPTDPDTLTIRAINIPERYDKGAYFARRANDIRYGSEAAAVIKAFKPDVVISGNTPLDSQQIILRATHEAGSSFVNWIQDFYSLAIDDIISKRWWGLGSFVARFYSHMERGQLTSSDHVVVISDDFRTYLQGSGVKLQDDLEPVSATLVFCAYNEERSLPEKIANLRAIRAVSPDIKFMAYVDKSTDRTLEILQDQGDLIKVIAATERTGKALGMRKLVAAADTEIMIFTDANVIVDPTSIPRMRRYFADPDVGGVCGTLIYTNAGESVTAMTGSVYWRLEEFIKKGESRRGSTMGADGSLFARRLSNYPEVPSHLLDDFIASMSVVFSNQRLVSAPDVLAYERSTSSAKDEFNRKRRIACRAYSSHRHMGRNLARMSPGDLFKYTSHRVLRWYSGFNALAALAFGLSFIALKFGLQYAVAVALGLVALLALGRFARVPGLSHAAEAVSSVYAASLGVIDAWRGRTYQTWQPAQSR